MVLLTGGLFEELPGGSIEERKKMDRLAVTVVAGHSRARVPHIDADVPRMLSVSNNKSSFTQNKSGVNSVDSFRS